MACWVISWWSFYTWFLPERETTSNLWLNSTKIHFLNYNFNFIRKNCKYLFGRNFSLVLLTKANLQKVFEYFQLNFQMIKFLSCRLNCHLIHLKMFVWKIQLLRINLTCASNKTWLASLWVIEVKFIFQGWEEFVTIQNNEEKFK